jgi:uncharacterized protein YPO0396
MVSEFVDLDTAHGIVVTASEQIKVLEEAKLHYEAYNDSGMKLYTAQSLKNDLNIHMLQREKKLVESEGRRLRTLKEERVAAARGAKEAFDDADKELRRLEDLRRTKGGDQIERLEEELKTLRKDAVRKSHDRDLVFGHCRNLGINLPHDADSFAAALDNAQRQLEVFGMEIKALKEDRDKLILEKDRTEGILRNNKRELESLKGRKNNIPAENIETRDSVLNDLYLKESDLPFVGELLEVLTDEARWRGAIERAYKDLALSVLVEDDLSPRIAEHVYSNNLAGRFSFIRKMPNNTDKLTPFDTNDRKYLSQKLEIKEGPHNLWLSRELRRAYDYLCAECLDEFHANENAITDTGLIKGRRTYHEKDDTEAISYRTNWVLGFDNLEKVGLYTQLVSDDSKRLTDINQNIERDDEDIQKKESLTEECKKLASFDFQRIDVASVEAAIESKTQLKLSLELDPELKNLGQAIEKQAKDRESASERYISAKSSVMTTDNDIKKIETRLNRVIQDSTGLIADYEAGLMLDKMISRICDELTLHNFYNTKEKLVKELNDDINKYTKLSEEAKSKTEFQFKHFKREWPKDASDQEADINSAQEFLSLLEKLKIEDLPRHRDNFVKQLTFQSRKYTTDLLAIFDQETKKIIKRVGIVNDSLKDVPFNCLDNKPTYLMIRVTKRHIPELDEFKEKIHDVSRHFLNNPKHMTEQRFAILKKIVGDLASQDRDKVLWRDTVIDVRNHLDFVGVEIDAEGNEVESYRSGSGKSGGQRQKLAATCLAAALRYQLGGRELGYPAYATVVFDEAFAKTDNEHTKLAMDIFTKMGFQMVMATPNKLIKVAEPYIGGAAYVYITNRNKSMITALQYDPERKALDLGEARGSLAPPEEDFAGTLAADSAAADRIAPGHIDDPASEDPAGGA